MVLPVMSTIVHIPYATTLLRLQTKVLVYIKVTTADEQSGWDHPLPVFWNILLSMRIKFYDILFEHKAESINYQKKNR
jgi:hypothetical protein